MYYTFQQCKNFENLLRFDTVTESLKVETFLRHGVYGEGATAYAFLPFLPRLYLEIKNNGL